MLLCLLILPTYAHGGYRAYAHAGRHHPPTGIFNGILRNILRKKTTAVRRFLRLNTNSQRRVGDSSDRKFIHNCK